ncbi:MAG: hypothetical protein KY475_19840 [Planctomycetes bacterium]|nr:hypothetical protein [Planctomycetota bacterium]
MRGWIDIALEHLAGHAVCGYSPGQAPASEPTGLAAMALLLHGRTAAAQPALRHLAEAQCEAGGVGIRRGEPNPQWPTSLAILAWQTSQDVRYRENLHKAIDSLLAVRGETMPRTPDLGHDTTLSAWPWVAGTHSWVEPTALAVLSLKAVGQSEHPRTREAVRMLIDRQIPGGGCNYGNTFCLGQKLRPHAQPTGLALAALAGESKGASRITASVAWLARNIDARTPVQSLCWALIGLAAHGAAPKNADSWLQDAWRRVSDRGVSSYKTALVLLAAKKRLQIAN